MTQNITAINQWFKRFGEHLLRWRWFVLIGICGLTLAGILGLPKIKFQMTVEDWFLDNDPLVIAKNAFKQTFGNYDYASVLVEAEDVFAPDILRMIRELGEELKATVPFADTVNSLTDFEFTRGTAEGIEIQNIVPEQIPTDPQTIEAIRRLAFSKPFLVNRLFSDDSKQAWIVLRLKPYPENAAQMLKKSPEVVVGEEVLKILRQDKYQHSAYRLKPSGTPALAAQESQFFASEAIRLILLSIVIATVVLFIALRSLRGIIVPLLVFAGAVVIVFGFMGHLGVEVNNAVITLPIYLGLVVAIAYSIHLFNFFERSFAISGQRHTAMLHAIEEVGWPTFFTATTTVGSLLSFYFVTIRQIRWMGLSSAAVVTMVYLLAMTFLPIALSFGRDRLPQSAESSYLHHVKVTAFTSLRVQIRRFDRWSESLLENSGRCILRHPKQILVVFALITALFSVGIKDVYISMDYERMYGLKVPYVKELYDIGQSKVGSMYSYDVTLSFATPDLAKQPEILRNVDILVSEISRLPKVKRVSSLLDMLKDLHQIMNNDDPTYYRAPDDQALVAQLLLLYELANGAEQQNWVDYDYRTLRLSVEVTAFDSAAVQEGFRTITRRAQELFPDAQVGLVGTLMQISIMQNYVAKGEIISFFISLLVIGLLMMIVFQSISTGLIGMIPNVAPQLLVLGLMGYLHIPLDMTTMMIVPMLLGLAVDDTIHFINHTKLEFQRTGSYEQSVHSTFVTIGKSIFMASLILIASFSAYLTSIAAFFVHLAVLLIIGVASALVAEYFVTPVLVYWLQPFGKEEERL